MRAEFIVSLNIGHSVRNRFIATGIQPCTYRRFIDCAHDYMEAVVEEARLREFDEVLDMNAFQTLRRNNSAVTTVLSLIPYCLHIDLMDDVIEHPVCQRMFFNAVDMVCWANVSILLISIASILLTNNCCTIRCRIYIPTTWSSRRVLMVITSSPS